jgi:hypothetical protein
VGMFVHRREGLNKQQKNMYTFSHLEQETKQNIKNSTEFQVMNFTVNLSFLLTSFRM